MIITWVKAADLLEICGWQGMTLIKVKSTFKAYIAVCLFQHEVRLFQSTVLQTVDCLCDMYVSRRQGEVWLLTAETERHPRYHKLH